MANLKEIRSRIASVSSTMQITSAMKMVSAAKLKKAQDAITAMRPYANKLTELLQNLSGSLDADTGSAYSEERPVKKVLLVAITSNRGLCGAFNSNIVKESISLMSNTFNEQEVHFMTVGKKGTDLLKKKNKVIADHSKVYDDLTFDNVAQIAEELMAYYVDGSYDKIVLVYNKFKNAATQILMTEQFLPIVAEKSESKNSVDYIFEPEKEKIVMEL
ncbi:MAG: ATP synthase F1 subunit gamma, partial [Muriicola sp.]|nr:ATP synthase F1 subunit gamma [Muriicola sp.]